MQPADIVSEKQGMASMNRLEPLPQYVAATLAAFSVAANDVLFCAGTDLDATGRFVDSWLVVTAQKLFIANGGSGAMSVTTYLLADIGELKAENLNGNGMLVAAGCADGVSGVDVASTAGQAIILCRYSNTMSSKFNQFARLANKVRKGEELKEQDFAGDIYKPVCPTCGLLYPDPKRRVCPKCLDKRALFLRVLSYLPRYKWQVCLILFFMLARSGLEIITPYLSGRIFWDQVLTQGGQYYGKVLQVMTAMAVVHFLSIVMAVMHGRITADLAPKVVFDLKTEVFAAMQRLSLGFFTSKETGTLMTRVSHDANNLQFFFHDGFPYFIVNLVNLIGVSTVMFTMNWRLTLLVLLPTPVIVLFVTKVFPRLWRAYGRRYRRAAALNAIINDTLSGIRVVKAFGKEDTERRRFAVRNKAVFRTNIELGYISSTLFPSLSLVMNTGGLLVWGVGGVQASTGMMTLGTLMTFIGYIGMLYQPLEWMTHIVDWWSSSMNSAQRIFEVLDAKPDVAERPHPVRLPQIAGRIELDNITFGYEPNKAVLETISMEIKPGEMIGVLGYSGAGKSTLVNLISRLYDVQEGAIRIDGVDVRDAAIQDLRDQIGMVLQDTYLFAGSIAENIAYAKPSASRDEIIEACRVASAHDFIVKLPNGYDTVIGHQGQNLSGGERQRLAIARAILHNPRILILDEATASVDTETERAIQEGLERLVKGRTTIAIAHRLSTLRNADRLLVIDKGKIAEMGTHEELIALEGHYFKMLQKQKEALKIRGVEVDEHELAGRVS